jgi:uncharacterized protein with GYD domain
VSNGVLAREAGLRYGQRRLEVDMPKYLLQASYSAEGSKGLLKDGGAKRVKAARTLIESLGGKLETI